MKGRCKNCRYWAKVGENIGRCIRAMSRNYDHQTKEDDFCDYFNKTEPDRYVFFPPRWGKARQ